jgi:methylated-DNA-[protein]-cysteine S-methyltransferase
MRSERSYHLFDTVFGTCAIVWSVGGLTRVRLPQADAGELAERLAANAAAWDSASPLPEVASTAIDAITRYMTGVRVDFRSVKLDWGAVPGYNARIYRALARVPYGSTTTYGALALEIGKPNAARAVGMAMGRNPWPIVIPCHRVLASGQQLGGFSAPGGVTTKISLLRLEGSLPGSDAPMLPGLFD